MLHGRMQLGEICPLDLPACIAPATKVNPDGMKKFKRNNKMGNIEK